MSLKYGTRGLWGGGSGGGATLSIASIVATSSTSLRITFSAPVLDTAVLRWVDAYVITTGTPGAVVPTVEAVTPEAVAEPNYVDLTTTEMTDGATYDVEVLTVEAA